MKVSHWIIALLLFTGVLFGLMTVIAGFDGSYGLTFENSSNYDDLEAMTDLVDDIQTEASRIDLEEDNFFVASAQSATVAGKLTTTSMSTFSKLVGSTADLLGLGFATEDGVNWFVVILFAVVTIAIFFAIISFVQRWDS